MTRHRSSYVDPRTDSWSVAGLYLFVAIVSGGFGLIVGALVGFPS